jgi:transcriptional regulator with XRE-family HTH domain
LTNYFRCPISERMNAAETLRQARLAAGMTQRALAAHLGITPGFLHDVENSRRRLAPKHFARLPDAIRGPVIDAALAELQDQADKLDKMR